MSQVIGIVVTHGNLAEELIKTAGTIVGAPENCFAMTNSGRTPQQLREDIDAKLDAAGGGPAVLFVDFFGGSCSHASLLVEHARDNIYVFCGVNLPMLLAFINKRDELSFEELAPAILERANNSIRLLDPTKL